MIINLYLISLNDLLDKVGHDICVSTLSNFSCDLDKDLDTFLKEKSLLFLDRSLSATFLLLNKYLLSEGFLQIESFFTLSYKALPRPEHISNNRVKQITGFKDSNILPFVLIGQIGKFHSSTSQYVSDIHLSEILDYVVSMVNHSSRYIPNKWLLVECNDAIHEKGLYEKEGFTYFQHDGTHHQYVILIFNQNHYVSLTLFAPNFVVVVLNPKGFRTPPPCWKQKLPSDT